MSLLRINTRLQFMFRKFIILGRKKQNEKRFIFALSILTGLVAGIAAVIIRNLAHFIEGLLKTGYFGEYSNYLFFIYPTIGILFVVVFVNYIIKKTLGHGVPSVLYSIAKKRGRISPHNMFSSVLTSSVTVGFGGSAGLEAPIVVTGAALGSNLGRAFRLDFKQISLLITCGCAAAMAAIFKAPIAGIVFAVEVIMIDLTMTSLVPLMLSSATAVLVSFLFMGTDAVYGYTIQPHVVLDDLLFYIGLGIIGGVLSAYFSKVYMFIEHFFTRFESPLKRLFIAGLLLGAIIFLFPPLYGEGYDVINDCLKGDYSFIFEHSVFSGPTNNFAIIALLLAGIIIFKVVASSLTFAAGGIGGIFAPTLIMGAVSGLLFALIFQYLGFENISIGNFVLLGMAALMSGILHAPLTGIFLIADITGGYGLFVPLMITSTVAYATAKGFYSHSVYTMLLAQRKHLMTHNKDKQALTFMHLDSLLETDFAQLHPDMTLGDLVKEIETSKRNVYPVVAANDKFLGVLTLNDVRKMMFKPELYDLLKVRDIMYTPDTFVHYEDTIEDIAKIIHTSGHFNIPVLSNGKYKGFVSRANLFLTYRNVVRKFSDD